MHEGGGRWVGNNKVVELKKKKKNSLLFLSLLLLHMIPEVLVHDIRGNM